ncbi:hypothetical protein AGLY_012324 [Aphis glycines]|uniref:MD-2-related lipid-recognition domain-containing protein n=1 Tax=Aphis glycines TaxID=307491 RepID=A0A6G0TA44_APHGL|nr:hypothetical protein AGLY_012324 [Aphis glycines]
MPNLPLGEYRVIFDRVYPCEPTKNHSIKCNLYFSKKTSSITELKGNITSMIPLDDTLTLDVNVASWSLTGGWKPNSIVYITKNACTNMKNVLGNVWYSLIKAFNGPITSCPLPAGTYITSGVDLKELEDYNAPKGEYRTVFEKIYSCESTNVFQYNLYFSKKTFNITEMKGNITFLLPLDDTLTLDINGASWGSIGGWKPNSIVYITKNTCSNSKNLLGNVWYSLIKAFNGHITSCPLPAVMYLRN